MKTVKAIRRSNVLALIEERYKGNRAAFARAINRPPPNVHRMLAEGDTDKRGIGEDLARDIEKRLGLALFSLDREDGAPTGIVNVIPGPELRGKVPLISWVQAGSAMEIVDLLHPGDGFDWVETTCQVQRHTYALRVTGDSMEPDFPAGMLLIVEPELDALPGDFVIAKNGDEEATFKQLVKDGGDWYLRPINKQYPTKPLEGFAIIGVVREAVRRLR